MVKNIFSVILAYNHLEIQVTDHSVRSLLAQTLQPGGFIILSGLTAEQAPGIQARYGAHGFVLEKRIILDGWATLVLGRRSARVLRD